MDINDIAEQIMNESAGISRNSPPSYAPSMQVTPENPAPDISKVNVPEEFISTIVESKEPSIEPIESLVQEEDKKVVSEELSSLLEEVKTILSEIKGVLNEMTTCGAIGVNQAGSTEKPKKEKKKEEDPMKALLKRIKAKKT